MTPAKITAAKAMLADGQMTVREICDQLKVGTSTFYRAFPAAKDAAKSGEWQPPKLRRPPINVVQQFSR